MTDPVNFSRRSTLKQLALGLSAMSLAGTATTARSEEPQLGEDEGSAKAVQYVTDVSKAPQAKPNQTCGNCSLYDGATGSTQAHCALFPGKLVKAAGWCSSWTNM